MYAYFNTKPQPCQPAQGRRLWMDKGFRKAPLAFCRKLCYADCGATSSTPVGGSPGFLFGGDTYSLPPIEREGVAVMGVSWSELFQFCMVILTVIALVLQNNKEK